MSLAPLPSLAPFATRAATLVATAALLVGALSGCASTSTESTSAPTTASSSAGSSDESTPPELPVPGSTNPASSITAPDGIPTGLTLTIVAPDVTGDAAADTTAAVAELRARAELRGAASIRVLPTDANAPLDSTALLEDALADAPDVIVVLGERTVVALDSISASNLDQQFVLIGAQLPEPTGNVTAVVWPGADTRLADGISPEIAPRASEALEVGLTAFAARNTGLVLELR